MAELRDPREVAREILPNAASMSAAIVTADRLAIVEWLKESARMRRGNAKGFGDAAHSHVIALLRELESAIRRAAGE